MIICCGFKSLVVEWSRFQSLYIDRLDWIQLDSVYPASDLIMVFE